MGNQRIGKELIVTVSTSATILEQSGAYFRQNTSKSTDWSAIMSLSMKLLLKKMFPLGFTNEMGAVLKGLICGAYVYMSGHLFVEKGSIEKTLFHRK